MVNIETHAGVMEHPSVKEAAPRRVLAGTLTGKLAYVAQVGVASQVIGVEPAKHL